MKVFLCALAYCMTTNSYAQSAGPYRESKAQGHLVKPAQVKFSPDLLKKIKVPKDFKVNVFAKDLGAPRMMVHDNEGNIYVSHPTEGEILILKDTNNDGAADTQATFIKGYEKAHGMAINENKLYFIALKKIYSVELKDSSKVKLLVDNLPNVGQHENRSLAIGPDKKLYVSIASNCNSCVDPEKTMASMQVFDLDGKNQKTFASGLRDTIGFDWHPNTGAFYGMDHGTDWMGEEFPREELNLLEQGKDYGWPFCWNEKKPDTNLIKDPEGMTKEEYCSKKTQGPVLTVDAHTAPIAFTFYKGDMFPNYKGSAFTALHGSWNRKKPRGYNVTMISFKDGKPVKSEEFMSGFLAKDGKSQFGRPAGLLELKDGSLLVSDDSAGVIYRVSR